jgi:cytochrome c
MGMRAFLLIGIVGFAAIVATSAGAAGDAKKGATVFARCGICHSSAKGEGNKIGPNLFGVVGRKAGSVADFSYSAAMKSAGFVWTDAKLDAYIKSPATVVPGNKMAFAGVPADGQRADLVAYLNTLK